MIRPRTPLLLPCILNALLGCGLGTEVGNGVKSDDEPGTTGVAKSDSSPDSGVPESASDEVPATGTAAPAAASSDSGVVLMPSLLTARCGSPFADNLVTGSLKARPVASSAAAGWPDVTAVHEDLPEVGMAPLPAGKAWTVRVPATQAARHVARDPKGTFSVLIAAADAPRADTEFTCSAVKTAASAVLPGVEGTFTQRTVVLRAGPQSYVVVWYLKGDPVVAPAALVKVDLTLSNGSRVSYDVAPVAAP